jgi:MFS transporter, DHA2 family, multidrug resistance protein
VSTLVSNRRETASPGVFLVTGIVLAALTEAIAGTALALGRGHMMGDTYATPDEIAWLDVGYTAFKLVGFVAAPWLMMRINPHNIMLGSCLAMALASALSTITAWLNLLIVLRVVQGFAGGVLLIAGQAIIFLVFPRKQQPILQAVFAVGAVVAPATIAPALQGWLLDSQSWAWIFFSIVPLALSAAGCLLLADKPTAATIAQRRFDWMGFLLISAALCCFTYVFSQGNRWDWFEQPRIVWLTTLGTAALLAFLGQQAMSQGRGLLDLSVFRAQDFPFAFIVSFVAGAALFGSAFLIPSFAISMLAFTPSAAGQLLLPSGVLFMGALLIAAFLMQALNVPPIAPVPFGIFLTMVAMWMLSGSTGESGADDMTAAMLLRGLGLGFLFLPIILIAFSGLTPQNLGSGIGLFNMGRQLGGLMGVAGLQTLIDHQTAANFAVLSASLTPGTPAVGQRLATTSAMLTAKGIEAADAGRVATGLLARSVTGQSAVIAFDTAFNAIALLFVVAAPVLVAAKIGFAYHARLREARGLSVRSITRRRTPRVTNACRRQAA